MKTGMNKELLEYLQAPQETALKGFKRNDMH